MKLEAFKKIKEASYAARLVWESNILREYSRVEWEDADAFSLKFSVMYNRRLAGEFFRRGTFSTLGSTRTIELLSQQTPEDRLDILANYPVNFHRINFWQFQYGLKAIARSVLKSESPELYPAILSAYIDAIGSVCSRTPTAIELYLAQSTDYWTHLAVAVLEKSPANPYQEEYYVIYKSLASRIQREVKRLDSMNDSMEQYMRDIAQATGMNADEFLNIVRLREREPAVRRVGSRLEMLDGTII